MSEEITEEARANWSRPTILLGALVGAIIVLGFALVHDIFITDIWFNLVPMILAGALIGLSVVWSYRSVEVNHSTSTWFRYLGLYSIEMIALGAVSLTVLQPKFTMAELMVVDDAFERLLPPSMPLMLGAMVIGTILFWLYLGRRPASLIPIASTQVLLVFFLGHQFAFLGLVESSSTLLRAFGEFALFTFGLAGAFGVGVLGSMSLFGYLKPQQGQGKPRD